MATIAEQAVRSASVIILDGIGWQTYEHLLRDYADRPSYRLAYDDGRLEIMAPSYEHERIKKIIAELIVGLALELEIEYESAGSTTFRSQSLGKGFEGDDSFYFTNLERIRQVKEIDLSQHPPPDLIVEVYLSSSSMNKFPIFSALGIREVWRYDNGHLSIHQLIGMSYQVAETSRIFSGVAAAALDDLIHDRGVTSGLVWQRRVREFARSVKPTF